MTVAETPQEQRTDGWRFVRCLERLTPAELSRLRFQAEQARGADVWAYDYFNALWRPLRRKDYYVPRRPCFLVFLLFPWNPLPNGRGSLGAALGAARRRVSSVGAAGITHLLHNAILPAPEEQLASVLLQAARLLHNHRIPVDWSRLIDDLDHWGDGGQEVQMHWLKDFGTTPLRKAKGRK